jgi:transposase
MPDAGLRLAGARCIKAKRRSITVRPRDQYEALQAARSREVSPGFRAEYSRRVGIEGTISQGVRACGLRRLRYLGETKAHLQHVATAAVAINVARITGWLAERTREVTRAATFARLMAPRWQPEE